MKVFITGKSGVGKTTILRELERRGYKTFDTDAVPGAARLEIKATGEPAKWPDGHIDWKRYSWNWQDVVIRKILHTDTTIFVGGIVGNQAAYYPLFDFIFVLTAADDELYRRRTSRKDHQKTDHIQNIEESVARNQADIAAFVKAGAIPIDNNRSVGEAADEVLTCIRKVEI